MAMFSGLARAVGYVTVRETATQIAISGLPADVIAKDISKIWKTTQINKFMFSELGSSSMSFPKFFAPELRYTLMALRDNSESFTRKSSLRKIIELMDEETWLVRTRDKQPDILDFSQLGRFKQSPLDKQVEFFNHYNDSVPRLGLHGYLLASPAGTGKTYMGVGLKEMLHADAGIVVCPKHTIYNAWVSEIRDQLGPDIKIWIAAEGKPLDLQADYYIFHYEALEQALDLVRFRNLRNPVILLDECHNMNEMKAQRTQNFIRLCELSAAKHIIWMSGTPLKAVGGEMIPLLRTIDPLFTPDVEFRFTKIYGQSTTRAQDILAHRMALVTYKVPKTEVVTGTPITTDVKVRIPDAERFTLKAIRAEMEAYIKQRMDYYQTNMRQYERIYNDAVELYARTIKTRKDQQDLDLYKSYIKEIRRNYDPVVMKTQAAYCNGFETKKITPTLPTPAQRKDFQKACSVVKYVFLVVQGEALGNILGKRRAECYTETVKNCDLGQLVRDSQKKTVFFGSYVETILAAKEVVEKDGFRPLIVYQDTNSQLNSIIKEFATVDDANPLIATFKSLSTGVRLIMANTVVLLNSPFREYEYEQTISRVHRLGQDTQVFIIRIVLDTGNEPNISTRSADILQWSKEQVEAIMGKDTAATVDLDATLLGYVDNDRGVMARMGTLLHNLFGL